MAERKPHLPTEIDTLEDRMGSVHPLDFDQDEDSRAGRIGDEVPADALADRFPDERVREAGTTEGERPGDQPTLDDLTPETLIPEDGARGPDEPGQGGPADQDLSEVDGRDIGAGGGLDEAEEARRHPLDGEPWDGPADGDADTGPSAGDATLGDSDENVLDDDELEGDAPLDSGPDRGPTR